MGSGNVAKNGWWLSEKKTGNGHTKQPKLPVFFYSYFKIYNNISPVRDDSFQAGGGVRSTEPLLEMIDLQS